MWPPSCLGEYSPLQRHTVIARLRPRSLYSKSKQECALCPQLEQNIITARLSSKSMVTYVHMAVSQKYGDFRKLRKKIGAGTDVTFFRGASDRATQPASQLASRHCEQKSTAEQATARPLCINRYMNAGWLKSQQASWARHGLVTQMTGSWLRRPGRRLNLPPPGKHKNTQSASKTPH